MQFAAQVRQILAYPLATLDHEGSVQTLAGVYIFQGMDPAQAAIRQSPQCIFELPNLELEGIIRSHVFLERRPLRYQYRGDATYCTRIVARDAVDEISLDTVGFVTFGRPPEQLP